MENLKKLNETILNSWKIIEPYLNGKSKYDFIEKIKFENLTLTIRIKESISLNINKKIDLNDYFKNLNNVFNDNLPSEKYFDLSTLFTKWEDLLKKEKLDLIIDEWINSLSILQSKIYDIEFEINSLSKCKDNIYKYLEIETDYICKDFHNNSEIIYYKPKQSILLNFNFELNINGCINDECILEVLSILKKNFIKVSKKIEVFKLNEKITSNSLLNLIEDKLVIIDKNTINIFNMNNQEPELIKKLDINIPHSYLSYISEYEGNLVIVSNRYDESLSPSPRFIFYISLWDIKVGYLIKKIEKIGRIIKVTSCYSKLIIGVCETKSGFHDKYEIFTFDLPNLNYLNFQKSIGQINSFLVIQNRILVSAGYDDFICLWEIKEGSLITKHFCHNLQI